MSEAKSWTQRDYVVSSQVRVAGNSVVFVGNKSLQGLDVTSGAVRFTAPLAANSDGGLALAATGDAVFVADSDTVQSFGLDGKQRWLSRVVTPGTVDGIYTSTAPIVTPTLVLFAGQLWSRVIAVNIATGAAWHTPAQGKDQPQALSIRGDMVVSFGYEDVVASALSDGKVRWRIPIARPVMPALVDSIRALPDLSQILLMDGNALIAVDVTGKELWRHQGALSFGGSNAGIAVSDGKQTTGLDPQTGTVRWQHDGRLTTGFDSKTVLVVSDGKIQTMAYSDGTITASATTILDAQTRVVATTNGKVVLADLTHAAIVSSPLTVTDVSDHAPLLGDRRLSYIQTVDAILNGVSVLQSKSGSLRAFR